MSGDFAGVEYVVDCKNIQVFLMICFCFRFFYLGSSISSPLIEKLRELLSDDQQSLP